MFKIITHLKKYTWSTACANGTKCFVYGWAFRAEEYFSGERLAKDVLDLLALGLSFPDVVASYNGHFGIVCDFGEELRIGADCIRSVPLFYRKIENGICVSDDIRSLLSDDHPLVRESIIEFATAGYVTGSHTLYSGVQGLQAGECVSFNKSETFSFVYDEHKCNYQMSDDGPETLAAFDDILLRSVGRACEHFGGRQVALPLSGGLDSRLLAVALKRLGYDNVICFAYGLQGNHEAVKSQQVAEKLGLAWFEIPYTGEGLRREYQSARMREFWSWTHDGTASPCITEWPAIKEAVENGWVQENAVFLSGQSGDFINGSHLRYLFATDPRTSWSSLLESIFSKHYSLWGNLLRKEEVRRVLSGRIAEVLGEMPTETDKQCAAAYEFWECRERQVKYVVGGARVFEFFGRDWAMPLWDREIMEFFRQVSIPLKLRGYLYAKYAAAYDPWGVFQDVVPSLLDHAQDTERFPARKDRCKKQVERLLGSLPGLGAALRYRKRVREHRHYYRYNPLGFPQAVGGRAYIYRDVHKKHVLSLWVRDILQKEYGVDIHDVYRKGRNHVRNLYLGSPQG